MTAETTLLQRSLLLTAPERLEWREAALAGPGAGELLVRTRAGAISIGTELPLYLGRSRGAYEPDYPLMTGYESLAEVVACGPNTPALRPGARVIAFYGHRTAAILAADRLVVVPDDIADGVALSLILACDTAKGVAKLSPPPGAPALITGAGTIGLLTLLNLRGQGLTAVDIVDPLASRRELALAFGARWAFAPGELPDSAGYSVGFECSSANRAFQTLQRQLQPHGQICVLADGNREPLELAPEFHAKELMVVGSSDGLDYRQYAGWFWEYVRRARPPLDRLFELRVGQAELSATFARIAAAQPAPLKVLVRYE